MKKRNILLFVLLVVLLVMGLVLSGCDSEDSWENTYTSGGGSSGGGGGSSSGGSSSGGSSGGGDGSSGGGGSGGQSANTFTPPSKSQIEDYVEDYRKNTNLMGGSAAIYIKTITINTYTVDGESINRSPPPVPENAQVQVKFTVKTNLSFNNLEMGERLNIDNFRIDLKSALTTWLTNQGFGRWNITITTGDTVFGG